MEEFNHFDQFSEELMKALSQVIRKTAFDVQAAAQAKAPVDTGFLRNSIYAETYDTSTYGQGGLGGPGQELLDPIESPDDEFTAYVAVGASYGIYIEMGTTRAPAQPFLDPALDSVQGAFESALEAIESQIKL